MISGFSISFKLSAFEDMHPVRLSKSSYPLLPARRLHDKIPAGNLHNPSSSSLLNAFSIHAHFYQPPRENPLTGFIPIEPSASPFSNWNERIHTECYRPNAELGNFERISFNIGPTLFQWMGNYDPHTCQSIIAQDHANVERHACGNAMAQAYNHTILPLASLQDKFTQVYWGIADFIHHFKRPPGGMWLPETAVDYETLDVLSRLGITHTILAPWQAADPQVDPGQPYLVELADQRKINVFFYQKDLSALVSFDSDATINADHFAREILNSCLERSSIRKGEPKLLLIASDGELYGHHKPLREHFLNRLVDGASSELKLSPSYPALWLREHPARQKIRINERTSWSCHHGVSRWMGLCACTPDNGEWKKRLREAFIRLASDLDQIYLDITQPIVQDPWRLRDRYIHVLLGQISIEALLGELASRRLTSESIHRVHLILEAQRERQRMFTSCGWFFEDFDRIEPRNNVAYAAQAVRLARLASGIDLEAQTRTDLNAVVSQVSGVNAGQLFERHLRLAEGIQEVRIGYAD